MVHGDRGCGAPYRHAENYPGMPLRLRMDLPSILIEVYFYKLNNQSHSVANITFVSCNKVFEKVHLFERSKNWILSLQNVSEKYVFAYSDMFKNGRTFSDTKESNRMKKLYGYARVSTQEQNLDRQLKALLDMGIDERDIVTDKTSGKSLEREGYQMLKNRMLRDGDTLVIKSLDRLSRNKSHIKQELEYFKQHHIRVMVLDLPTTLIDLPEGQEWVFEMINNILIEVLASIAEQERLTIRQRQAEGIEVAKQEGKHLGRPQMEYPPNWDEVYRTWKNKEITAVAAMEKLGLKRSTFYRLVKSFTTT